MSAQGFLSRWSQRKQDAKTAPAPEPVVVAEEAPVENIPVVANEEPVQEEALTVEQEAMIADLPDVETLTPESDFSAFMQTGVPEELKRLALRKLWRSNPIFANLDGLNDYDEDFTIIQPLAEGVAEELQKLMKENSRTEPVEEEETAEGEEEQLEETAEAVDDDDDEVGEGEDE
ncbi:DUF3306 domain-containing protein [Terasakiella sp. A23]|uniref:DUF3306 domain-containing protein n=1 Tax=Terasakiella sp. FCG-A23 TaxID=3080561 RepID=UPI002955C40D|nr:DUF3306 domain-containing protein [Terasakiella sp. A23]MDV7340229.1 DUF3306 domain-containing protein [Terasakiella sp. A23]